MGPRRLVHLGGCASSTSFQPRYVGDNSALPQREEHVQVGARGREERLSYHV